MGRSARVRLETLADATYAAFQRRLCPDTKLEILGVRLPVLRKLAQEIASADWRAYLAGAGRTCYEEVMLEGLVIAGAKAPAEEKLNRIWNLLPALDCWALTDSIAPSLSFRKADRDAVWNFAQRCLADPAAYTRRFGILLLMKRFLTPEDASRVLACVVALKDDRYYVQMAVAWLLAELGVSQYDLVVQVLASGKLDTFTQNKAVQKMRESRRFPQAKKDALLSWKREAAVS